MIQVYTGDGKGKTTAAIGLAIRALGAGHRVFLMQFMKSLAYSEQHILQKMPNLTLETTGKPFFIAEEGMMDERAHEAFGDDVVIFPKGQPPDDYVALLTSGLAPALSVISKGETELVILDEINIALSFGLVRRDGTRLHGAQCAAMAARPCRSDYGNAGSAPLLRTRNQCAQRD